MSPSVNPRTKPMTFSPSRTTSVGHECCQEISDSSGLLFGVGQFSSAVLPPTPLRVVPVENEHGMTYQLPYAIVLIYCAARWASPIIESMGFTPEAAGKRLPSQTKRPLTP